MGITLDSTSERLTRTTSLPTSSTWTILGWLRHDSQSGDQIYFMLEDGSNYVLGGFVSSEFFIQANSNNDSTATVPSNQTWFQCVLQQNGTGTNAASVRWRYPGGSWTSLSVTPNALATCDALTVGNDPSDPNAFLGTLSNFKLYNSYLTQAQYELELDQFTPQLFTDLQGWWPFVGGTSRSVDWTRTGDLSESGSPVDGPDPPIPWGMSEAGLLVPLVTASGLDFNFQSFRFYEDDGYETGTPYPTALANEDTNASESANTGVRIRVQLQAPESGQYQLEVDYVGGSNWMKVI